MTGVWFDHLAVGCADLEQGAAWAEATLGARLGPGGAHPQMGTHNLLGALSAGYLELIAVDPEAPGPRLKRWYDLDNPTLRGALSARPRPVAWVLAVDNLEDAVAKAAWNPGLLLTVSRGDLRWRITVPADGAPPLGVMPTLIEWPETLKRRAPVDRMTGLGLALRRLTLRAAEPALVREKLESVKAEAVMRASGVELAVKPRENAEDAPLEAMFTPSVLDARA